MLPAILSSKPIISAINDTALSLRSVARFADRISHGRVGLHVFHAVEVHHA